MALTVSKPRVAVEPAFDLRSATFQAAVPIKREVRNVTIPEVRMESDASGKRYLTGYTALYSSLSHNLGSERKPWKERIMPGAFSRALREQHDVRHLQNHDRNLILGRTKSGTLLLSEDQTGLHYKTLLPDTTYANDLAEVVARGDVDEQSFGFVALKESWVKEDGIDIRQLEDLSLADISTVVYGAYPGTSTSVESRMFPDGVPESVQEHIGAETETHVHKIAAACGVTEERVRQVIMNAHKSAAAAQAAPEPAAPPAPKNDPKTDCECTCDSCVAGVCANCGNAECTDVNCTDCPQQLSAAATAQASAKLEESRVAVHAMEQRTRQALALPAETGREFRAAKNEDVLELMIYEDIGESWFSSGVTALGVKQQIDSNPGVSKIRVRLNSFGGDVFEGIAICNLLRSQGVPVDVYVDGLAASAASVIAMAGSSIYMANNAMMMIHNVSSGVYGYASDMRKTADVLDTISGAAAQTYVDRAGKSKKAIQELMDAETWMNAADCVKEGFATAVWDPDKGIEDRALSMIRSSRMLRMYSNVPDKFKLPPEPVEDNGEAEALQLRMRLALVSAS